MYNKARHRGTLGDWQPKNPTTQMPSTFEQWVNDNKARWQANGKAAPFFIRDNYQQGDVDKGLDTRITAAIEEAKLAAATAKAKAKPTTPEPITEWDSEVMELRKIESAYSLDLDKMEHLRTEGTDRAALRKEINKQQRSYQQKKGKWEQAYQEARNQLLGLMGLLVTYQKQENTREFWELRDTIIPNHQSAIEDNDLSYGVSYHHAVKSLKSIKKTIEELYNKFETIFKAEAKGTTTPSGVTMKTEYKKENDVNATLKALNAKMNKGSRWFENGTPNLQKELPSNGDNGSTTMDGNIKLKQEIKDRVMSALAKMGKGESEKITREEAQAIGTFWHEITHNRHITTSDGGNAGKTDSTTRKEMELANEWVARHTLDEFYSTLGVKNIPHPEFMTNRDNTGYNSMVTNYDYVIDKLGLDRTEALSTVKQYLFNGNYITQAEGLKNGLLDAGIKKADGSTPTVREMTSLLVKIRDLEGKMEWDDTKKCWVKKTKEQLLDEWLQAQGFIKP